MHLLPSIAPAQPQLPEITLPEEAHGTIHQALAYWTARRGGRELPLRGDLDPAAIPRLLPNIILLDVVPEPLDFRYRLIGEVVRIRIRDNYKGVLMSQIPYQTRGTNIWASYERVVQTRRPLFETLGYVGPDNYVRGVQHLLLPWSSDGATPSSILTLIQYDVRLKSRPASAAAA